MVVTDMSAITEKDHGHVLAHSSGRAERRKYLRCSDW